MSDLIVLKFGGSSVADNEKLNIVADKIIKFYKSGQKIVVIVSAQGKTTDKLIKEANSLSAKPQARELDTLLSCGEQMTISKLAILLNEKEIPAISLTGWQAGIKTTIDNQKAIIEKIDATRIKKELSKNKVVVIAGFQGINDKNDITTLGRGGSDTTAVAVAAILNADKCYIYSDVDGVYTADPKEIKTAQKLDNISYSEMIEIADEGAKVLNNRSVKIAQKYNIPIIAKSTFDDKHETVVSDKFIENVGIKSMIKRDITKVSIVGNGILKNMDELKKLIYLINFYKIKCLKLEITDSKIEIYTEENISEEIMEKMHNNIIKT